MDERCAPRRHGPRSTLPRGRTGSARHDAGGVCVPRCVMRGEDRALHDGAALPGQQRAAGLRRGHASLHGWPMVCYARDPYLCRHGRCRAVRSARPMLGCGAWPRPRASSTRPPRTPTSPARRWSARAAPALPSRGRATTRVLSRRGRCGCTRSGSIRPTSVRPGAGVSRRRPAGSCASSRRRRSWARAPRTSRRSSS
jgi:hypothetical protein